MLLFINSHAQTQANGSTDFHFSLLFVLSTTPTTCENNEMAKQPPPKDPDRYYEDTNKIKLNPQGGKQFGREWQQRENNLRQIAEQYR